MISKRYVNIKFRAIYNFPTNYATHNLYPYPAKFIPHVVRFFLEKYTDKTDTVFDPFSGSGTVAIESEIVGRNYIVWDLNPIIEILVKAETWKGSISFDVKKSNDVFYPKWKNIEYWHPREFIEELGKYWAYYHENPNPLLAIVLMKVTKYFSYAELEFPKLYKSKKARERVQKLLSSNWKDIMNKMIEEEKKKIQKKVLEFQKLAHNVIGIVKGGVDSLNSQLPEFDALITSPPYLQAQEYIRTFKLELHWLGYTDEQIRELEKKEIPYNNPVKTKVESDTYDKYLQLINEFKNENLIRIYTNYFYSLVNFLNKIDCKVIGLFVGPVKVRNIRIPIDTILREHLETRGWKHEATYIDTIVSRRIKKVNVNPATKIQDERTPTEHLLILRKLKVL